jgi:hypothetical protein
VKSFYKALVCQETTSFPWKSIWRVKAGCVLCLDNSFREDFNS